MSKKTVYLHIGHYKTGTSAIQAYLSDHAKDLARHGYLYPACARPQNNSTNHGHLSLSLGREHGFNPPPWYGAKISSTEAFDALHKEIATSPLDKVIVSSEEFLQLALCASYEAALSALQAQLKDYDVRVLFYLREPMSLLKSWYNEVNKGPAGTANFPTFARNLSADFLGQKLIADRFAAVFGAGALSLRTYRLVGNAHIAAFLNAVGCNMVPTEALPLVNEAQSNELLEARRLAKAQMAERADPGLSRISSAETYLNHFAAISETYDALSAFADHPIRSQLSATAIMEHYAELVRAIPPAMREQREADRMRDLAMSIESRDMHFAHAMMSVASIIRPKGPKIIEKLAEYRAALGLAASG